MCCSEGPTNINFLKVIIGGLRYWWAASSIRFIPRLTGMFQVGIDYPDDYFVGPLHGSTHADVKNMKDMLIGNYRLRTMSKRFPLLMLVRRYLRVGRARHRLPHGCPRGGELWFLARSRQYCKPPWPAIYVAGHITYYREYQTAHLKALFEDSGPDDQRVLLSRSFVYIDP